MEITNELFNELKRNAIDIWLTYDDAYGYASEKIDYLNSFGNVSDNYGTIIGMFDTSNQRKLYNKVSPEAQALIDKWVGGLESNEQLMRELGL